MNNINWVDSIVLGMDNETEKHWRNEASLLDELLVDIPDIVKTSVLQEIINLGQSVRSLRFEKLAPGKYVVQFPIPVNQPTRVPESQFPHPAWAIAGLGLIMGLMGFSLGLSAVMKSYKETK